MHADNFPDYQTYFASTEEEQMISLEIKKLLEKQAIEKASPRGFFSKIFTVKKRWWLSSNYKYQETQLFPKFTFQDGEYSASTGFDS